MKVRLESRKMRANEDSRSETGGVESQEETGDGEVETEGAEEALGKASARITPLASLMVSPLS